MSWSSKAHPTADIVEWLGRTWRVTLVSLIASLAVALVVTGSLFIAQRLIQPAAADSAVALGPWQVSVPETTLAQSVSFVFFLTLASVSTSLLTATNAALVRRFLHTQTLRVEAGGWRYLVLERNLLESWTNYLSLGGQGLAYGVALGIVVGGLEWLGLVLAAALLAAVNLRIWKVARGVSVNLVTLRREHRNQSLTSEAPGIDALIEGLYQRDRRAFRPSVVLTTVISAGILVVTLTPAFMTLEGAALVLPILMVMFWRQKVMDFISSTGRLAWLVTQYQHQATSNDDDE